MDKPKLLIIDDDEALCESLRDTIELEGYVTEIARTGRDGIKKVKNNFYNIVLLDMKLPDSDGIEVLEKIKEISSDTEVVMFTAYAATGSVIEAMDRNAFSYLPKPFEIPYLISTLKKACEKQALIFENRRLFQQISDEKRDWENTFDSISDPISIHDMDSKITRCNKALADKLNIKPEDIVGRKCYEIYHGRNEPLSECPLSGCREMLKPSQLEMDCFGGTFLISDYPRFDKSGKLNGIVHIARDITAHKRFEKRLLESEEQFRSTFEQAGVGIAHVSLNGQFLKVNSFFCEIFGYMESEILNLLTFQDITHSNELETDINYENLLLNGKIKTHTIEKRFLKKDGTIIWTNINVSLVRKTDGEPKYFVSVVDDITERKRNKKALQESEEKFRTISATANDAIIMADSNGIVSYWNKSAERIFGYSEEEVIGKVLNESIVPEKFRMGHLKGFGEFQKSGKGSIIGKTTELTAKNKDGLEFPIDISASAIKLKNECYSVGIIRDITERIQMEEKMILSAKMASLGQLTASVFHELLNPVNIISSHVQLLLMETEGGSQTEEDLKSIQEEIKRIVKITDGLLRFSRKGQLETEKIDTNNLLEKTISLVEHEMNLDNIIFIRTLDTSIPKILANRDELRQVFLNLINNARDAMPEGGTITVSTRIVQSSEPGVHQTVRQTESQKEEDFTPGTSHSEHKGDFVEISFEDAGCGIDRETTKKIFDPFFTTKLEGKGTGLGLSTSYGIIKTHGGSMSVESKLEKGTTFTIYLPVET